MNRPDDLVAIPPVWRTVLYYLIAEVLIVSGAMAAGAWGWNLAGLIAQGNAILFFGTAAAKVSKTPEPSVTVTPDVVIVPDVALEPLPSERG